ncbi:MAG: DUF934 domain-containing protein [Pseudomonadota bacterium]|nr:DUF934 domain-containing protein [Pseudomonadota bacterium]
MKKLIAVDPSTYSAININPRKQPKERLLGLADYLKLSTLDRARQVVLLEPDEDIDAVFEAIGGPSIIALNFPSFFDGRPFSTASILRQRYAYKGDIRAVGAVRVDQLEQMYRCGFSSFEIDDDPLSNTLVSAVQFFSYHYQSMISDSADRHAYNSHNTAKRVQGP